MSQWITGVHHIALKPTPAQVDRTVWFYRDFLGLEEVRAWGDPERPNRMFSCGDGTCIELLSREEAAPSDGAIPHFALATDRVDELIEVLRKEGFPIYQEPKTVVLAGTPCRIAFFFGPVGEKIELFWEDCHE